MALAWYILIHTSLGLIGYRLLDFSNLGMLAAIALCASVQLWPTYELYRLTWPKFENMRAHAGSVEQRRQETRDYWLRMGRLDVFRVSAFTLLTLFVAWLMRG